MNFNSYGSYYGKFHQCTVASVEQNIIVFSFGNSKYETWFVTRMHPPEKIYIDSKKPFLLALKTFFKSDVPASVVCNDNYLWTVCLGNERMIYPIGKDVKKDDMLQLYATPFFVSSVDVIHQYLQGTIRPAYENVFFYKNTILYLDNEDLPCPGGSYFDKREPTPFYRICFLSNESRKHVLKVALEWQSRRDVFTVNYMTRESVCVPKFIDFKPVSHHGFPDGYSSTNIIHKNLSSSKPEHLIQDILNSYYADVARRSHKDQTIEFSSLGLVVEWPFSVPFEGSRLSENERSSQTRQFVALRINGTHPNRVLHVCRPYERYMELNEAFPTLFTPISFVLSTFASDPGVQKVAIDTTVLGVVYRETFFCFSQPLLEGMPTTKANVNGQYILNVANFELKDDVNIRVIEKFKYNDKYSLCRVSLKSVSMDTWCLVKSLDTDPYPKTIKLPDLVKRWTDFFMEVGDDTFDLDVSAVRLALMLSKHNICFNLVAAKNPNRVIKVSDKEVNFYMDQKILQFINEVRMITTDVKEMEDEEGKEQGCLLS